MKLMMHSFDFGECLLTFRVPQDVMWNNRFGNVPDGVEVDMAAITDNAALGIKELAATDSQHTQHAIAALRSALSCHPVGLDLTDAIVASFEKELQQHAGA
jgi:hypothetical protein